MAVDMFLKMPPIKGEAQDKTHKDDMDVLAWSWGMSNSGSAHIGGGAGSGKVNVHDLSVTKWVDKASCDLMKAACNGRHFDEAKLVVRKAGTNPLEYITITMNKVFVTSVSTGGSGGEDRLTENVTLNFAKVKVEYKQQDDKGSVGATPNMTWDISKNAES